MSEQVEKSVSKEKGKGKANSVDEIPKVRESVLKPLMPEIEVQPEVIDRVLKERANKLSNAGFKADKDLAEKVLKVYAELIQADKSEIPYDLVDPVIQLMSDARGYGVAVESSDIGPILDSYLDGLASSGRAYTDEGQGAKAYRWLKSVSNLAEGVTEIPDKVLPKVTGQLFLNEMARELAQFENPERIKELEEGLVEQVLDSCLESEAFRRNPGVERKKAAELIENYIKQKQTSVSLVDKTV